MRPSGSGRCNLLVLLLFLHALAHGEDLQEIIAGEFACVASETASLFLVVPYLEREALLLLFTASRSAFKRPI